MARVIEFLKTAWALSKPKPSEPPAVPQPPTEPLPVPAKDAPDCENDPSEELEELKAQNAALMEQLNAKATENRRNAAEENRARLLEIRAFNPPFDEIAEHIEPLLKMGLKNQYKPEMKRGLAQAARLAFSVMPANQKIRVQKAILDYLRGEAEKGALGEGQTQLPAPVSEPDAYAQYFQTPAGEAANVR